MPDQEQGYVTADGRQIGGTVMDIVILPCVLVGLRRL